MAVSGISAVATSLPEAKTTASFFILPRELQVHIFSFVDQTELLQTLALVCKAWWKLSNDPSLWKRLNIDVHSEEQTGVLARILILKQSSMLTELRIQTRYSLEEFAALSYACPKLKHLNLTECQKLDNRILAMFVQNCPMIEELNVAACPIDEESVQSIACLSHLRVLNLSYCVSVNDDFIQLISENCPMIEELNVADCPIDEESVQSIACLSHLRVLNLSYCDSVDDDCIQLISEKCRHLEDLNLSKIAGITDRSFCNLDGNWNSTLLRLVLDGGCLTDLAFSRISLFTKLCRLWILNCERLTDQTLIYLKTLTNLKSLVLHDSALMTTVAINNFFGGSHVHNLVQLEMLRNKIDDDGVCTVTQNCKLLRILSLRQCYRVTEVGVEHIVKNCDNLINLNLTLNHSVTGHSLYSIPENLSCLQILDFSLCSGIDLSVLRDLAIRVPRLRIYFP